MEVRSVGSVGNFSIARMQLYISKLNAVKH